MTAAAGTLVLARRDISALMAPADWLAAVETGFRAAAEGRGHACTRALGVWETQSWVSSTASRHQR